MKKLEVIYTLQRGRISKGEGFSGFIDYRLQLSLLSKSEYKLDSEIVATSRWILRPINRLLLSTERAGVV